RSGGIRQGCCLRRPARGGGNRRARVFRNGLFDRNGGLCGLLGGVGTRRRGGGELRRQRLQRRRFARDLLAAGAASGPVGDQHGFLEAIYARHPLLLRAAAVERGAEGALELGLVAAIGGLQRLG